MPDRKSCGKYLRTRKTLDIEVDELQQQKMTSHPVIQEQETEVTLRHRITETGLLMIGKTSPGLFPILSSPVSMSVSLLFLMFFFKCDRSKLFSDFYNWCEPYKYTLLSPYHSSFKNCIKCSTRLILIHGEHWFQTFIKDQIHIKIIIFYF